MAYKIITQNVTSRGMRLVADIGDGFFKVKFNKEASDGISFFYDFLIADYKNIKPCYRDCMKYTDEDGNPYGELCEASDHNYPDFHWACSLNLYTYDVEYQDEISGGDVSETNFSMNTQNWAKRLSRMLSCILPPSMTS